jgi:hypothetical protein
MIIPYPFDLVILVGGLAWCYTVLVLLFLWIPFLIDEISSENAFSKLLRSIRIHYKNIFDSWLVFLVIIMLLLLPYPIFHTWMSVNNMEKTYGSEPVIILQLWTLAGCIAILIIILPAIILAFTQMHIKLKEEV